MPTDVPPWTAATERPPGRRRPAWPWVAAAAALVAAGAGLGLLWRTHRLPVPHFGHARPTGHAPTAPAPASHLPAVLYSPQKPPPPWPGPLPYPLLITDATNGRITEVTPSDQVVWQYPGTSAGTGASLSPTDAAFAPDGSVIAASERQDVVARIDFASRQVAWKFGALGQAGNDATHLDYPDDPHVLPNGDTVVADIRNCRELTLGPDGKLVAAWGKAQSGYCQTDLAKQLFGYPNGDAPQPDGSILMSFSSGDHVALLSPAGKVLWDVTAPNLYGGFVSDAEMAPGGDVIVCGYATPGSVVRFSPTQGGTRWTYFVPSGAGALSRPTDAIPLPNGDVAVADGGNHRVVVIDPGTNQIVWQFNTGLSDPEGIDLDLYRAWPH